MNERAWVLTGRRYVSSYWWLHLHRLQEGTPSSVACDYAWALTREEQRRDVVGFYHTHPGFSAIPSARDVRTMWAWVASFGKPLLCAIDGIDGLRGYWFTDDETMPQEQRMYRLPGTKNFIIARGPIDGHEDLPRKTNSDL